jgi:hypothetical protein
VGIQTVFEGYRVNTKDKLRKNQLKYDLKIPMAHAAGNPQTHTAPEIMRKYRSGGTPWTVIIDPDGKVVFNDFHIDANLAAESGYAGQAIYGYGGKRFIDILLTPLNKITSSPRIK